MDHGTAMFSLPWNEALSALFMLVGAHFLGDFGLQSEWVAKFKNRHMKKMLSPDVAAHLIPSWYWLLTGHAFIHGLLVVTVTHSVLLGVLEVITHWVIDFGKCEGWYGFQADQSFHILVKVGYVALILFGPGIGS